MTLTLKTYNESYALDESGEFRCMHADAEIVEACCSSPTDCACNGQDSVWCPNDECTGITAQDMGRIMSYV